MPNGLTGPGPDTPVVYDPPHPRMSGANPSGGRPRQRLPIGGNDAVIQFSAAFCERMLRRRLRGVDVRIGVPLAAIKGLVEEDPTFDFALAAFAHDEHEMDVRLEPRDVRVLNAETIGLVVDGPALLIGDGRAVGTIRAELELPIDERVDSTAAEIDVVTSPARARLRLLSFSSTSGKGPLDLLTTSTQKRVLSAVRSLGSQQILPTISLVGSSRMFSTPPPGEEVPSAEAFEFSLVEATLAVTPMTGGNGLSLQVRVESRPTPAGDQQESFIADADYGLLLGEAIVRRIVRYKWRRWGLVRRFDSAGRISATRRGAGAEDAEIRGEFALETLAQVNIAVDTITGGGYLQLVGSGTSTPREIVFLSDGERISLEQFDRNGVDVGSRSRQWSIGMVALAGGTFDANPSVARVQLAAFWDLWNGMQRPFARQTFAPTAPDIRLATDMRVDIDARVLAFTGFIPDGSTTATW